jgi:hypothetical protein
MFKKTIFATALCACVCLSRAFSPIGLESAARVLTKHPSVAAPIATATEGFVDGDFLAVSTVQATADTVGSFNTTSFLEGIGCGAAIFGTVDLVSAWDNTQPKPSGHAEAVPEPLSMPCLLIGFATLVARRFRRSRK